MDTCSFRINRTQSKATLLLIALILGLLISAYCQSHPGRRFEVQLMNNTLLVQGVNTSERLPMGEQAKRPYQNVIHDHLSTYIVNNQSTSTTTLPGFDLPSTLKRLHNHSLTLKVLDLYLVNQDQLNQSQPIVKSALPKNDEVTITFSEKKISSKNLPDDLVLTDKLLTQGMYDLDPLYQYSGVLTSDFLVIECQLSSNATGIKPSNPVFIILAPSGHKYHTKALQLEKRLAKTMYKQ